MERIIKDFLTYDVIRNAVYFAGIAEYTGGWVQGRQGTGYFKYDLRRSLGGEIPHQLEEIVNQSVKEIGMKMWKGMWDCHILKYPNGSFIPPHKDECNALGHRHVRLNAIVRRGRGGDFKIDGRVIDLSEGDAVVFFPDEQSHEVTMVSDGPRLVLSIGAFVRREDEDVQDG